MWSPITIRQWAVSQSTPNFAAPTRSANCCQVSYITRAGRTTRGKLTMSLCTGMLRSMSLGISCLLRGGETAVEVKSLSSDEVRGSRNEKQNAVPNVLGLADTAERNARHQGVIEIRVGQ